MYESKYSKYLIQNTNRFATREEVIGFCKANKKDSTERFSGAPVFYDGESLYVDSSDAHIMTDGATGSKKTRVSVINTILAFLAAGESGVITDPKGELYRKTAGSAKAAGYNVWCFDLRSPKRSDCWNPMQLPHKLDIRGNKEKAEEMLDDFIESLTAPAKLKTKDDYWVDRVNSYLNGIAGLLMDSVSADVFNISTLMNIAGKKNKALLEKLIKICDEKQPFINSLESFLSLRAEKTSDCLYEVMEQVFGPYSKNGALLNILCENEIDFAELADKNNKTVIYIIYPDEKLSMAFIVNLFLTQCYLYLMQYIADNRLARLEKRVNFVCEEFGNLPKVDGFPKRISEARGYNIRYFLYIQSYGQLENTYKEEAKTIKANCDWIVYPSKEISFLREVSELCGDVKDCYGNTRPLLSVDRIQQLKKYQDGAEVVVIKNGKYPFIVKLPDYEYIDIFERYEAAEPEDKERHFLDYTLTMDAWKRGIENRKYNIPFSPLPRRCDLRIAQPKNTGTARSAAKAKKQTTDGISAEEMKKLEARIYALFSSLFDDDED